MTATPELEIRTAVPADLDPIGAVYRRASLSNEGDRDALLANPDALEFDPEPVAAGLTRVAVVGARVVGFVTARPGPADALELDDLFVDPDWMRRGIATALVRDVEQAARAAAVACVEVTANGHALAFYRAVGFTVTGTVETRFGPGTRMRLDTGPSWRRLTML
jgi:ribosomal protein S18 acetylase RimI-like enzyme